MFGLGFGEILLLMAIGLIVLGPKQMPQVARVLGRTLAELRRAMSEVTNQMRMELDDEVKKDHRQPDSPAVKREVAATKTVETPPAAPKSGPGWVPDEIPELPPHPPIKSDDGENS